MNKTKPQRIDPKQVQQFFADAQKRTSAARKNLAIDAETTYQITYEAKIKGSLALMLSHGQRPRKQLGHHIAIIEFAQKNLPGCPAGTFALFDRMRRKRNDAFMTSPSSAIQKLRKQSPQLKHICILLRWT